MSYNPLTPKEEIQLKLDVIHQNTAREESHYMAEIRANVVVKWDATAAFIQGLQASAA